MSTHRRTKDVRYDGMEQMLTYIAVSCALLSHLGALAVRVEYDDGFDEPAFSPTFGATRNAIGSPDASRTICFSVLPVDGLVN